MRTCMAFVVFMDSLINLGFFCNTRNVSAPIEKQVTVRISRISLSFNIPDDYEIFVPRHNLVIVLMLCYPYVGSGGSN